MATTLTAPNGTITGGAIAPPVTSPYMNNQVTSPSVVTSAPATKDLNNIQTNLTNTQQGIQTQAQTVAANQANAAANAAANAKLQNETTVANAKANALTGAFSASDLAKGTTPAVNPQGAPNPLNNTNPTGTTPVNGNGTPVTAPTQATTNSQTANTIPPETTGSPEADALNLQAFQQGQQAASDILAIQQGTIPLSQGEQAQVTALQNQYQQLIGQTQTANTSYQNALKILGAGNERYDPMTQLGIINGAVQQGSQKISQLDSQMSSAIATLEQGFKTNDIAAIKEANDTFPPSGLRGSAEEVATTGRQLLAASC